MLFSDVVLIESLKRINKELRRLQHLLLGAPILELLLVGDTLEDLGGFGDKLSSSRWCRERSKLTDSLNGQAIDGARSCFHRGDGSRKRLFGGVHLRLSCVSNDVSRIFLNLSNGLFFLGLFSLFVDNNNEFVSLRFFDLDVLHSEHKFLLKDIDLIGGITHSGQTTLEACNRVHDGTLLIREQLLVEVDELEERGWRGVVESPLALPEIVVSSVDGEMDKGHMVGNCCTDLLGGELDLGEEPLSDTDQGIPRPGMEPIDRGRTNQGGEFTCAETECVTDGREAETHVEVLLHLVDEEVLQAFGSIENALGLGLTTDLAVDTIKFIGSEELGNVTGGQNIIDVDEELLIDDLRIGQDEEHLLALDTSLHEKGLDVGLEIGESVVGGNNNPVHILVKDECGEFGKRLLTRTTHTDKKGMAVRLEENSTDTSDVLHGLIEENEVHDGDGLVVLLELGLKYISKFFHLLNGLVRWFVALAHGNERGVDERFLEDNFFLEVSKLFEAVSHVAHVCVDIIIKEEPIEPDSVALVSPHADESGRVLLVGSWLSEHAVLNDLGDITHVELVMELGCSGGKLR